MVVSLYVSEVPKHMEKDDLFNLFKEFSGFKDLRVKLFQDKGKICFVDFDNENDAKAVISLLNGIKYSDGHKGFNIKLSDNSKGNQPSNNNSQSGYTKQRESNSFKRSRSRSRSPIMKKRRRSSTPPRDRERRPINQEPQLNNNSNIIQSLLSNMITNPQPNNDQLTNTLISLISNQPSNNQIVKENNQPTNYHHSDIKHKLNSFDDKFRDLTSFGKHSTNIVFIEGLPNDCSEREIAHVLRPFPGYMSSRIIERDKNGEKNLICFSDFEEIHQATACIYTLQGYRFDKNDLVGLHLSYGVSKHKQSKSNY
jgi:RNA recognition motif-containing protein